MCHVLRELPSSCADYPCPNSFERRAASHVAAAKGTGAKPWRSDAARDRDRGRDAWRLSDNVSSAVDGSVIAENMTELETQFLVSEMIERIPSLRVAASDDAEQPLER
jgi:hypothetical protein